VVYGDAELARPPGTGVIPVFSSLVNARYIGARDLPANSQNSAFECYLHVVDTPRPTFLDALDPGSPTALLDDLSEVWAAYSSARARGASPFIAAATVASTVDRLGFAFAVGYPAALEHMVPGVALPCALCITEDEGNHPRAIQTTLQPAGPGYVLDGVKSFVTFGTQAASLIIAARAGFQPDGRPALAVVQVPSDRAGIGLQEHPPTPFVPEVPHARLTLRGVEVLEDERLRGDGYTGYVKPFRTIEDIHVLGTAFAYLLGVARRAGAPAGLIAMLADGLASLDRLSVEAPLDPRVHVALHGAYERLLATTESPELRALFEGAQSDERLRWERDRPLLGIASKAREARFRRASQQLGLS